MSLREDMWKYEQITGESAEHVPIIKLGAFLDGYEMGLKALEQQPCDDAISRQAVIQIIENKLNPCTDMFKSLEMSEIKEDVEHMSPVTPQHTRWIPVSERLPKAFEFVNCTCHSLIDDREDWVVETVYVPQPSYSPYSDWGNIPMLNSGDCEVVAWMHRDIPEPYRESGEKE